MDQQNYLLVLEDSCLDNYKCLLNIVKPNVQHNLLLVRNIHAFKSTSEMPSSPSSSNILCPLKSVLECLHPSVVLQKPDIGEVLPAGAHTFGMQVPSASTSRKTDLLDPTTL